MKHCREIAGEFPERGHSVEGVGALFVRAEEVS